MQATIPSQSSNAGPEPAPLDLTDRMFEVEYSAEMANRSYKRGATNAALRTRLEAAKDAIDSALELL